MASTYFILVGGFSTFIYTLLFNPSNSSLTTVSQVTCGASPSWLSQHPSDPTIVYATQDVFYTPGTIYSLVMDKTTGQLTSKSSINTGTANGNGGAVYIGNVNNGSALVAANYNSGSAFIVSLGSDKTSFSGSGQLIQFTGSGPLAQQRGAHAHMSIQHGNEILVADLGSDKVWRLTQASAQSQWSIAGSLSFAPGSGPRHIVALDNTLYTLHEMCSCLTQSTLPPLSSTTAPQLIANISVIPSDTQSRVGMRAGELLYATSPEGGSASPLLYASNRDDASSTGDAIAIFETTPSLKLVAQIRTGLKHLRGVNFVGPEKKWIIAGGQMGGGIKIYERVSASAGYLKQIVAYPAGTINQPASFVWV